MHNIIKIYVWAEPYVNFLQGETTPLNIEEFLQNIHDIIIQSTIQYYTNVHYFVPQTPRSTSLLPPWPLDVTDDILSTKTVHLITQKSLMS